MKKAFIAILVSVAIAVSITGCTEAEIASTNLSKEADQFNVYRRVVFYNGITDQYILEIDGYCSVEFFTDKFVVTVKTDDGKYMKHYLGRADNVFPFVEQLDSRGVSTRQYKVIFRPSVINPDIELK